MGRLFALLKRLKVDKNTLIIFTSDHGDLLGAHGGLHQKWFNLYDEATRVPFIIARVGSSPTTPARIEDPTSHVDLVPTLLAAAGRFSIGEERPKSPPLRPLLPPPLLPPPPPLF